MAAVASSEDPKQDYDAPSSPKLDSLSFDELSCVLTAECDALKTADLSCGDSYKRELVLLKKADESRRALAQIRESKETLQRICKEVQTSSAAISEKQALVMASEEEKCSNIAKSVAEQMLPVQKKEEAEFEKEKAESAELKEQLVRFIAEYGEKTKLYEEQEKAREEQFAKFEESIDDIVKKAEEKETVCEELEKKRMFLEMETDKKRRIVNGLLTKVNEKQKGMEDVNADFDAVTGALEFWRTSKVKWRKELNKVTEQVALSKELEKVKKNMKMVKN